MLCPEPAAPMGKALIVITGLLIAVSLPHALEDLQYGDVLNLDLSARAGAITLAVAYGVQLTGVWLVLHGKWPGAVLLSAMGAVWCIGAIVVHGHDLLFAGPAYRHGLISRALEVSVMILGAAATLIGLFTARAMKVQLTVEKVL